MKRVVCLTLFACLAGGLSWAADKPEIKSEDDKVSYSVGHQVGRDLVRQKVEVNPELVYQGIMDAVGQQEPMIPFDEMLDTLVALKERIVEESKKAGQAVRILGKRFLEENASKEGVVTLDSGLQYKVLKAGTGKTPTEKDRVKVSYTGRDIDGNIFGSTLQNGQETPVEFKVTDVVPGWFEALQMMKEGAKWELYIPPSLAFKDAGPLAGQTVVFEIELLAVVK